MKVCEAIPNFPAFAAIVHSYARIVDGLRLVRNHLGFLASVDNESVRHEGLRNLFLDGLPVSIPDI